MLSAARAPVARHLPAARRGVVGRADRLHQHLGRRDAERERERAVAVVREEPVVAGAQVSARGRAAAPRAPRRRSGRTPGSAGAARSRGRRRSGRRARAGSRRAPRRGVDVERSRRLRRRALRVRVYGLPWEVGDPARDPSVAPARRRATRGGSSRPRCAISPASWASIRAALLGRGAGGRVTRDDVSRPPAAIRRARRGRAVRQHPAAHRGRRCSRRSRRPRTR